MKVRPLVITETEKANIQRVMAHASSHRISTVQLEGIIAGVSAPPGKNKYHTCIIPIGYYCIYTEEEQPKLGVCRHLSVAVMGEGCAPNEVAVQALMTEFGFRGGLKDLDHVWTDDLPHGKVAVNVLQRIAAPVPDGKV